MRLHELKPPTRGKKKKRIGRGGKRGTYSGRGQKGQGARAGAKKPKIALGAVLKFPKLRGAKNKPARAKPALVSLEDIQKAGLVGIVKSALIDKGLVKRNSGEIKILSDGKLEIAVVVGKNIKTSRKAREKIEKAGGKILL